MAWRIDEQVVRGEIDNRVRGRMTGRIWFNGRAEPVELALQGNGWRDVAGRRLAFVNPAPKLDLPASFAARQEGVVGDITASRKVRVPDTPLDQLHLYYKTGREMPWLWGNSLYLEWFSQRNGRVVIETAGFELTVIGDPAWEMTAAEEEAQRRANGEALIGFMDRLGEVFTAAETGEAADATAAETNAESSGAEEDEGEWSEKPETEAEAEARQARSDLLADRIAARLEREGEDADYESILEEEIDRLRRERGEPDPTPEQLAENAAWIEEANRAAEEALANPDPEAAAELDFRHPLVERAAALHSGLYHQANGENWLPENAGQEHPVRELLDATMMAGAKLAGALNSREWPPPLECCAGAIVRLKKAREYLDDALRAAESCQEEKLLTSRHLGPVVVELADLAQETDDFIAELRAKLARETD
ncbi:hypothetical protein K0B96_17100 [Horticoccus luteus]|uniref:Uncharacterized protein n=1 Tax=Horticoccus luteus TaxID=2862869 RepID=A0A8F9XJT1_9BACT|nr:hypothetical protein [Horticoccus luteus]QYM78998.1 hypothetical protein K0B96_17100 [Horticoccus luteus]